MSTRTSVALSATALGVFIAAPAADAGIYEYKYSGVILVIDNIDGVEDDTFNSVALEDPWEFTVRVDTDASPTGGIPPFYGTGVGTNYDAIIAAGLTVGDVEFPFGPVPDGFDSSVYLTSGDIGTDLFGKFLYAMGFQMGVALFDGDELALGGDESIPTSLSPEWDPEQSALIINFGDTLGEAQAQILGAVLESSVTFIPSPGPAVLLFSAGFLAASRRRRVL